MHVQDVLQKIVDKVDSSWHERKFEEVLCDENDSGGRFESHVKFWGGAVAKMQFRTRFLSTERPWRPEGIIVAGRDCHGLKPIRPDLVVQQNLPWPSRELLCWCSGVTAYAVNLQRLAYEIPPLIFRISQCCVYKPNNGTIWTLISSPSISEVTVFDMPN